MGCAGTGAGAPRRGETKPARSIFLLRIATLACRQSELFSMKPQGRAQTTDVPWCPRRHVGERARTHELVARLKARETRYRTATRAHRSGTEHCGNAERQEHELYRLMNCSRQAEFGHKQPYGETNGEWTLDGTNRPAVASIKRRLSGGPFLGMRACTESTAGTF